MAVLLNLSVGEVEIGRFQGLADQTEEWKQQALGSVRHFGL